jgi:hypothetical protein
MRRHQGSDLAPVPGVYMGPATGGTTKEKLPDKGLEPLTTRLRVLRSAD